MALGLGAARTVVLRSFDGGRWNAVNAATVVNDTGDNLMINQKGAAKEAYPLDLRFEP
ncbi:hypothetical protein [Nonomuraea jabiensis]|uniref:hypothetical protein n=1 Tax=Nonomuraea jabiensis TaxID=882448 RepID=UPI003D74B7A7